MNNKKNFILLSLVLSIIFSIGFSPVLVYSEKTDTGLGFTKIEETAEDKGGENPGPYNPGNAGGNNNVLLPQTGELLSAYVLVLLGIFISLVTIGYYSIKQVYII